MIHSLALQPTTNDAKSSGRLYGTANNDAFARPLAQQLFWHASQSIAPALVELVRCVLRVCGCDYVHLQTVVGRAVANCVLRPHDVDLTFRVPARYANLHNAVRAVFAADSLSIESTKTLFHSLLLCFYFVRAESGFKKQTSRGIATVGQLLKAHETRPVKISLARTFDIVSNQTNCNDDDQTDDIRLVLLDLLDEMQAKDNFPLSDKLVDLLATLGQPHFFFFAAHFSWFFLSFFRQSQR